MFHCAPGNYKISKHLLFPFWYVGWRVNIPINLCRRLIFAFAYVGDDQHRCASPSVASFLHSHCRLHAQIIFSSIYTCRKFSCSRAKATQNNNNNNEVDRTNHFSYRIQHLLIGQIILCLILLVFLCIAETYVRAAKTVLIIFSYAASLFLAVGQHVRYFQVFYF